MKSLYWTGKEHICLCEGCVDEWLDTRDTPLREVGPTSDLEPCTLCEKVKELVRSLRLTGQYLFECILFHDLLK